MTEDNFEKFLKKTAQGYNAPPAHVPREEMWSAIQAKRAAGPHVVYGGGATYLVRHKFGAKVWLGAAAAALLLVATGVGIGRWTARPSANAVATTQPPPTVPTHPVVVEAPDVGASVGSASTGTTPGAPSGASRNTMDQRVAGDGRRAVATNPPPRGERQLAIGAPSTPAPSSAYQLTAVRHLSEAEALLTSFRARSTADQQMDAQLGAWARQLLSNTRLLLDSPVANDPQRRPLLEDLELVLVQIVQLSPGSAPQDRELIEKTLQQDHVMTRLRTAIPAGSQRGG
jgi:hypothetical protein